MLIDTLRVWLGLGSSLCLILCIIHLLNFTHTHSDISLGGVAITLAGTVVGFIGFTKKI
jgi:hypothetical protein